MKMNMRRLAMGLGLGAVVVLAGCAAYPAGTYYDGGGYSSGGYGYGGGYNAYEGGYYPGTAPVIIQQPPVYVNGGGYYRRPEYRGDYRGDYRDRDGRPGYNRPPNRPPQNVDRPNRPDPRPPVTRPNRPAPSSGYPPVVPGSPSPVQPNGQYVN